MNKLRMWHEVPGTFFLYSNGKENILLEYRS